MKLSRSVAVAAAVAVVTPVALFAATPALAAGTSATQVQNQPTYKELEKAAADTKKAYDDAVAAEAEGQTKIEATLASLNSPTNPLKKAVTDADQAVKDAAAAQETAEKAVADAKAKLEAAPTDEEKAAAQQVLDAVEADLAKAVDARQKADTAAEEAQDALDDARVAAFRELGVLQNNLEKAEKAMNDAAAAFAAAKECVDENGLTTLAVGLPAKVVAGTTVDFTLRVTNGTKRTLTVDPLVFFHEEGEQAAGKSDLKVEWSNGSGWQALNGVGPEHLARIDSMEPGERSDVKMRMTVDAKAKTADAFALVAGDAKDVYNPCILGPMKRYDFELLPAGSETGPVDDAKGGPGKDDDKRPGAAAPGKGNGPSANGGATKLTAQPAATGTDGNLAETGAPSSTAPLALASVVAVALGAGTVFTVRRRRTAGKS